MRIQHNIMAMNSYRNYTNNASALSKNLEKLSSGYKINRAGDDAAGLAISEKMRAQIQGLNAAQKNVKDGISLVKTAEGAMQEIQDMLSRMKYLATQSANGTYDEEVDRVALQDEIEALRAEINRIADSANFNGTNLLDGGAGGGKSTKAKAELYDEPTVTYTADVNTVSSALTTSFGSESNIGVTVKGSGVSSVKFVIAAATASNNNASIAVDFSGGVLTITITQAGSQGKGFATLGITDLVSAINDKIAQVAASAGVTISGDIDLDVVGSAGAVNAGISVTVTPATSATAGDFGIAKIDVTNSKASTAGDIKAAWDGTDTLTVTVGNKTYTATIDKTAVELQGTTLTLEGASEGDTITVTFADDNSAIGTDATTAISEDTIGEFTPGKSGGGSGDGYVKVQLQIGDSSETYDKLIFKIGDMHTTAMGEVERETDDEGTVYTLVDDEATIDNIDISNIEGANKALNVIKEAINYVSAVRGNLGAIQNRLEHTQNNLSVMAENIQDAESTIRDTDVADEMMGYVKNNILIQSAQAMLAQANQVPQGVLQLLG